MEKDTLDDLHRAGLFRFHQPKRWGGMELPFVAMFDVPAEIARGCASTGWNVANLCIHHWMLALYDERAQEEVWGPDPDALIASGIAFPQGRGRRVDGGFVISGFWNFSSGVDPASWNMLAVTVRDGERVVDHRMCLVPRGEYEIVDDWQVLGMRSTGSKSVRATEVFVPEHRALCMYLTSAAATSFPGARGNPNPHLPRAAGRARLALSGRRRRRQRAGRARADDRGDQGAQHQLHRPCACATSRPYSSAWPAPAPRWTPPGWSSAPTASRPSASRRTGRAPTLEEKLRFKRNVAWAMEQCTEAVDSLHALAGANGIYDRYPIQRLFRDQHALVRPHRLQLGRPGRAVGAGRDGGRVLAPTM